jgi:hypothetical protein
MLSPTKSLKSRRLMLSGLAALFVVSGAVIVRSGAAAESRPAVAVVGKTRLPADLPVTLLTGKKATTLADISGAKATVLLFVGVECPISNKFAPDVSALTRAYAAKGVPIVPVYANYGTVETDALQHAKQYFPQNRLLLDLKQTLADAVGATVTPEAVVLDAERTIRYRGRIDDRFVERGKAKTTGAATSDLRAALDSILAGKPVKTPQTVAIGCAIERAPKTVAKAAVTGPTLRAKSQRF